MIENAKINSLIQFKNLIKTKPNIMAKVKPNTDKYNSLIVLGNEPNANNIAIKGKYLMAIIKYVFAFSNFSTSFISTVLLKNKK